MADENKKNKAEDEKTQADESEDSLESFITKHYNQQKDEGRLVATEDIDDERTNNFFARAITESRRMNAEVIKSQEKSSKLAEEFGLSTMRAWQAEHAAEVLSPAQAELLNTPP